MRANINIPVTIAALAGGIGFIGTVLKMDHNIVTGLSSQRLGSEGGTIPAIEVIECPVLDIEITFSTIALYVEFYPVGLGFEGYFIDQDNRFHRADHRIGIGDGDITGHIHTGETDQVVGGRGLIEGDVTGDRPHGIGGVVGPVGGMGVGPVAPGPSRVGTALPDGVIILGRVAKFDLFFGTDDTGDPEIVNIAVPGSLGVGVEPPIIVGITHCNGPVVGVIVETGGDGPGDVRAVFQDSVHIELDGLAVVAESAVMPGVGGDGAGGGECLPARGGIQDDPKMISIVSAEFEAAVHPTVVVALGYDPVPIGRSPGGIALEPGFHSK